MQGTTDISKDSNVFYVNIWIDSTHKLHCKCKDVVESIRIRDSIINENIDYTIVQYTTEDGYYRLHVKVKGTLFHTEKLNLDTLIMLRDQFR